MKAERKEMSYIQKVFYIVSFIFLIAAFIYLGQKNYSIPKGKLADNEKFTEEYGISSQNVFVYKKNSEILEALNTGESIIFMAFPENKWSSTYAELLNIAALNLNIPEIYYYNFKLDRSNNNHYYQKIVSRLASYLPVLDNDTADIYSPTLIIVKDGKILAYDDETSILHGDLSVDDYWTEKKKNQKLSELYQLLQINLENEE